MNATQRPPGHDVSVGGLPFMEGELSRPLRGHLSRRRVWGLAILFVLWVSVVTLLVFKLAGQTADDFFITYRYSQNLLAGNGFVFNPGERVFGTTAPGWGLILAAGSWVTGIAVPKLGTLGAGVALLVLAGLLVTTGAGRQRPWEAAFAGSLALTAVYFWVHNGSETFALLALLAVAARAAGRFPAAAGVAAGFCVWLRPEALLAVGLLGLLLARENKLENKRLPLRYGAAAAATVAAGLAAAVLYFGAPLPNTLGAKRLQVAWNVEIWSGGLGFWRQGWRWLSASYAGPWTALLVAGGLAGHVSLLRTRDRALSVLALFSLALTVSYPLLGIPFYTWYLMPMLLASLYGLCFLAGDLLRWAAERRFRSPAALAAVLVAAVLVLPLSWHASKRMAYGYGTFQGIPQIELYQAAGAWIQAHTPPDADVAHVEVGALAYASRRPVRDLLGLVSPETLEHVARRDLAGSLRAVDPELVVDLSRLRPLVGPILRQPWFEETYEPVATFEASLSDDVLVLYRRR